MFISTGGLIQGGDFKLPYLPVGTPAASSRLLSGGTISAGAV